MKARVPFAAKAAAVLVAAVIAGATIGVWPAIAPGGASAQRATEQSDAQVRQEIIKESVAAYKATGRPCACPFDLMRNGASCGDRSAYSRPGGASPLCYPKDVTDTRVSDWRRRHPR